MKQNLKITGFTLLFACLAFASMAQAKKERCHPYTTINGLKGSGAIKAKQLSSLKSLEVINECKDGRTYTIMSFDFAIIANKKATSKLKGKYGDLTPEMKKALAKCSAGSKVVFTNVSVKSGDGKMEGIQGVTLQVK